MYHFFSLPFIFGTISPSMRDSRLAIRMCHCCSDKEPVELPSVHTRTKLITDNPIAAAQVFDLVMRAFFFLLLQESHLIISLVKELMSIVYSRLTRVIMLVFLADYMLTTV